VRAGDICLWKAPALRIATGVTACDNAEFAGCVHGAKRCAGSGVPSHGWRDLADYQRPPLPRTLPLRKQ